MGTPAAMRDEDGRRMRLPRGVWIGLVLFAVLQVGLLALNVLGIGRQEQLLERQLGLAEQSFDATRPAVQDARRLLDDARDRLPQTKQRASDAARLVDETRPLIGELSVMDVAGAVDAAGRLALMLQDGDRLIGLIDDSRRMLEQVERSGTVEAVRDMRGVLHQVLSIQRRTLLAQQQALAVQRSTLAVQQEALTHIRSIDRKTGGTVPGR